MKNILFLSIILLSFSSNILAQGQISGHVYCYSPGGTGMENVRVTISGDMLANDIFVLTDGEGAYSVSNLPLGGNYLITPSKASTSLLNGVTTFDMVLMMKNVLQTSSLGPFQLLAADVNRDGQLTVFDMIVIRQWILAIITDPMGRGWRFASTDFEFPSPASPQGQGSVDHIEVFSLQGTISHIDFVGVHLGDINDSNSCE